MRLSSVSSWSKARVVGNESLWRRCSDCFRFCMSRRLVTEEDYNFIRQTVYDIMQADDDYEELVYDATIQTDENRWLSVSEGLADMYQAIRNFVGVYQERIEDCMTDALWAVMDNFELYWGQSLVDTLRQLHKLRYTQQKDLDEDTL